jgi:hypothetical protein
MISWYQHIISHAFSYVYVSIISYHNSFDFGVHWISDLEYEELNTAKSCQMYSIQEDIKRISSPGWDGQSTLAGCSYQWKIRY